jgi:hypothetical protein
MVRVIQNPINARWPEATILLGIERDDEGNEHTRAEVWTADRFVELYDTKPIKDERLEGPSPLVHCFNRVPSNLSRYWCPCVGPALTHQSNSGARTPKSCYEYFRIRCSGAGPSDRHDVINIYTWGFNVPYGKVAFPLQYIDMSMATVAGSYPQVILRLRC